MGMPPEYTPGVNGFHAEQCLNLCFLFMRDSLYPSVIPPCPSLPSLCEQAQQQKELLTVLNQGEARVNGMKLRRGTFRLNISELY